MNPGIVFIAGSLHNRGAIKINKINSTVAIIIRENPLSSSRNEKLFDFSSLSLSLSYLYVEIYTSFLFCQIFIGRILNWGCRDFEEN